MNKLDKLEEKVGHNYVVRTGGTSFQTYLFGQMVYHKREFFLILPFEGCVFQEGEGDEDSWLGVGVYEKK